MKDALRLGMRRLAASVCVLSAKVGDRQYAMTASSVTSVSDSPASLLVCVNQDAALQAVLAKGQPFVINVLSQQQQDISNACASREEGTQRFEVGQWLYDDNDMPYLADAQASFFCRVDNDSYIYGTHQIVIGQLDKLEVSEDKVEPLIYVDGAYSSLQPL